jgi:hypothetical protein
MTGYEEEERKALWDWIKAHGVACFWPLLAEMAADRVREVSQIEKPEPGEKMQLAQWTRAQNKLKDLSEWMVLFGPGSDCK